jgi:hypothetical protein
MARELLEQSWAQDLIARPGVTAFAGADDITTRLERLRAGETLTA